MAYLFLVRPCESLQRVDPHERKDKVNLSAVIHVIALLSTGLLAGVFLGDRVGLGFARPALPTPAFVQLQQSRICASRFGYLRIALCFCAHVESERPDQQHPNDLECCRSACERDGILETVGASEHGSGSSRAGRFRPGGAGVDFGLTNR